MHVKIPPRVICGIIRPEPEPVAKGMDIAISPSLAAKLGSIVTHAEKFRGGGATNVTLNSLLGDPEVQQWLAMLREKEMV